MTDDKAQLHRLRQMDGETLGAVHDEYFSEIYRFAHYRLGEHEAAADVAAEVFLHLLEALHAGRGPRKNLHGWLFRTASNTVNDRFRRSYRQPTQPLGQSLPSEAPDPERFAEAQNRYQDLRGAMADLTEEQQKVIALRFGSGLSIEETAAVMDKKPNAVKALQFRAVASLRRLLEAAET